LYGTIGLTARQKVSVLRRTEHLKPAESSAPQPVEARI